MVWSLSNGDRAAVASPRDCKGQGYSRLAAMPLDNFDRQVGVVHRSKAVR